MKLFQHSNGTIFAFGFDMVQRKRAPRMISWSDPMTGSWDAEVANQAGNMVSPHEIDPEFVREVSGGTLVAYQPGMCVEISYIGPPVVWHFRINRPDCSDHRAVA